MTKNIFIPSIIIIFCILIIYAIYNNYNNNKLKNFIESFQDKNLNKNVINNANYNINYTKALANGSWTCLNTEVDSNYNVTNLMLVDTTANTITLDSVIYNILSINNDLITAQNPNNKNLVITIKYNNEFSIEKSNVLNKQFKDSYEIRSVVTLFNKNVILSRHASYKIYNNKAGGKIYRIIKSGDYLIESISPTYDFKTYNVLIGDYIYPQNYISLVFGSNNNTEYYNTITNKYAGKLRFAIQRVYDSPTGNQITTHCSEPLLINALSGAIIPDTINILPFNEDNSVNNFKSFFKPKSTILYFYQLVNVNVSYEYTDTNPIVQPQSVLNLQNNSNSMFLENVQYNNLNSVAQLNKSTYNMILITEYPVSDQNTNISIDFSIMYNFL